MELNVLSTHENALKFRAQRNQVLSANIANADTPGYKARDLDFDAALKQASGKGVRLMGTSDRHLGVGTSTTAITSEHLKYRVPTQPTLDGNTVETDVEQAAFAENALMYRASLTFLDGSIKTLRYALKGGD